MKSLTLSLLLFSQICFASGNIQLLPSYDPERGRTNISFGLGIWEKLSDTMAYNSWTGVGDSFDLGTKYHSWAISKHQIDMKVSEDLKFSPGVRLNYLDDRETGDEKRLYGDVFAKIEYKLW